MALVLMLIFGIMMAVVTQSVMQQTSLSVSQRQDAEKKWVISSAIETFLIALKFAEANYMIQARHCDIAAPLLQAMAAGHTCSAIGTIKVFTAADLDGLSAAEQQNFIYAGGWSVLKSGPATGPSTLQILSLKIGSDVISISYLHSNRFKNHTEFMASLAVNGSATTINKRFWVFNDDVPNRLHMNSTDNTVLMENPIPNDPCPNSPWIAYQNYDGTGCASFSNLAGGTGLASYHGALFGFRSADAQVVSMTNLATNNYMVDTSGDLAGVKVFPPYSQDALVNVDDIEVVGEDQGLDQIYAVNGSGISTVLSYLDTPNDNLIPVCNLGLMGWSMSFSGIAGTSTNQVLLPGAIAHAIAGSANVAMFQLKADNGDLMYAVVKSVVTSSLMGTLEPEYLTKDAASGRTFMCSVFKGNNTSAVENSRTLGFTRGRSFYRQSFDRPYFFY